MSEPYSTLWSSPAHWETRLGAMAMLVVLSLVLERALSVFFEWGFWKEWLEKRKLRGPIALVSAYVICVFGNFDLFSTVFAKPEGWLSPYSFGVFATAAVIAGGSKGAIRLLQDILGFSAEAIDARKRAAPGAPAPRTAPAPAAALPSPVIPTPELAGQPN